MDPDKRAELLMDHYKDTFGHIEYHWKLRNRIFLLALLLLVGICVDLYYPGFFSSLVNAYIQKNLASEGFASALPTVGLHVVGSGIWFLLLCLVVNYYQRSIHVDRQYKYLATIESQLDKLLGPDLITREGLAYKSATGVVKPGDTGKRPLFLRAIGKLYTFAFPLFLMAIVIAKIVCECRAEDQDWRFVGFDGIAGLGLILYNVLYLRWVYKRE
jgi:ABC-type multidrug transport system fused ATPase/permease subunit